MIKKNSIKLKKLYRLLPMEHEILNEDGTLKGYIKISWENGIQYLVDLFLRFKYISYVVLDEAKNERLRIHPINKYLFAYPSWNGVIINENGEKPFSIYMERKLQARWHLDIFIDDRSFFMKDSTLGVKPKFYNQQGQLIAQCTWDWKYNIFVELGSAGTVLLTIMLSK